MRLLRNQQGQALIIAMVLLLLGALVITPMLAYMWSGLKAEKDVHEKRMNELYAADAGVEHGLWHLLDIERLKDLVEDRTGDTLPDDWTPEDYTNWPLPSYPLDEKINGKDVGVIIDYFPADKTFKITSTALSEATATSEVGSSTTIVCYASGLDFTNLLQNAITSQSEVTLQSKVKVYGTDDGGDVVWCEGDEPPQNQVIGGEVIQDCEVRWPQVDVLSGWYLDDVDGDDTTVFASDILDLRDWPEIGPFYRDGNLDIKNTGSETMTMLESTVYVNGDLVFKEPGVPKAYTINLNGQTIFADGEIYFPPQSEDKDVITIEGPGCIIAVGDINFQPAIKGENFIFVMSITGTTQFQPRGNFYGSIAGSVEVNLKPGSTLTWVEPTQGLNFPGSNTTKFIPEIKSWEIKTNMP